MKSDIDKERERYLVRLEDFVWKVGKRIGLVKEKVYLRDNENPPEGKTVMMGPRGGRYYDADNVQPASTTNWDEVDDDTFFKATGIEGAIAVEFDGRTWVVTEFWGSHATLLCTDGEMRTYTRNEVADMVQKGIMEARGEPTFSEYVSKDYGTVARLQSIFKNTKGFKKEWGDAVKEYCNWSFEEMNKYLRGGYDEEQVKSEYVQRNVQRVEYMKEWIAHSPKFRGMTFRGMDIEEDDEFFDELKSAIEKGTTVLLPGFTSTTRKRATGMKFVPKKGIGMLFRITGSRGVPVDGLGKWEEEEIVYPPGMRFKVKSMELEEETIRKIWIVTLVEADEVTKEIVETKVVEKGKATNRFMFIPEDFIFLKPEGI